MPTLPPARERTVSRLAIVIAACGCCLSLRCDQVPGVGYPATSDQVLIVGSITPTSGPISGGTKLTIQGLEFAESTAVFFGNVPASDIEVVDDPAKMWNGGDPQLERAIQEVMHSLEASPPTIRSSVRWPRCRRHRLRR